MKFLTEVLQKKHRREDFICKHDSLSNYIKLQASKEVKRGLAKVYVLSNSKNIVIGYYTLSAAELSKDCVPEQLQRQLPRGYSGYPAILLGRLAIISSETGKGLGGELMVDAICQCIEASNHIGTRAIIVDPIDSDAVQFYCKFMFQALPDSTRMLLHIDTNLRNHFGMSLP